MARNWTQHQLDAITARDGSVIVSAAAGSGKTAVLVERVIRLITDADNGVDATVIGEVLTGDIGVILCFVADDHSA